MPPAARDRLANRRRVVCSRVLADEAEEDPSLSGARGRKYREQQRAARRPAQVYQSGVRRRLRGRWFHLVPAYGRQLTMVMTAIACLVALLIGVGYLAVVWSPLALRPMVGRPLRLDMPGGVADWVGSQMLMMSAGIAVLIYQLRRYRGDDYHGRYRMWRTIVVVLSLLSLDAVAHLRTGFAAVIDATWAQNAVIAGDDVVRLLLLLAGCAVLLPLIAELHRSASATACLFCAFATLALPTAIRIHLVDVSPELAGTWAGAARLIGRSLILCASVCYLRLLYREVRGMELAGESVWSKLNPAAWRRAKDDEAEASGKKRKAKPDADDADAGTEAADEKPSLWSRIWPRRKNEAEDEEDLRSYRRSRRQEDDEDESEDDEDNDRDEDDYDDDDDDVEDRRRATPARPNAAPATNAGNRAFPSTSTNSQNSGNKAAPQVAASRPQASQAPASTAKPNAANAAAAKALEKSAPDEGDEAPAKRGWFFGRRKNNAVSEDADSKQADTTKTASKDKQAAKKSVAADTDEGEVTEKKSRWFFGRKSKEAVDPADEKSKTAAKDQKEDGENGTKRRGWFSRGKDTKNDESESAKVSQPAKSAQPVKATAPDKNAEDKSGDAPKKGLFSWAKRNSAPAEPETAAENKTSKQPVPAAATNKQPARQTDDDDDDDDDDGDENSHLSRAERRRQKKLARRQGRAA